MTNGIVRMALASGLALVMGCLAVGCGGESSDDEENGGGSAGTGSGEVGEVDTGLPEDRPLQEVSAEDFANACEALRQSVRDRFGPDRAVAGFCEAYSGGSTDDPDQCRSAVPGCVSQVNAGEHPLGLTREQLDFTAFECGDTGSLEGCTATVGELETCLDDRMTGVEAVQAENDCDNAASVSFLSLPVLLAAATTAPASCSRVEQACPGLAPVVGSPAP